MVVDGKPPSSTTRAVVAAPCITIWPPLLYDAKADLPQELRQDLLNHYLWSSVAARTLQ